MAMKSIIEVDVQDESFARFQAAFNQYREHLKTMSPAWHDVTTEATKAGKAITGAADALKHEENSLTTISKVQGGLKKTVTGFADVWKGLGRSSAGFLGNIEKATGSLLKWGAVFSAGSAIMAGGGLFGLTRLAADNAGRRQTALQLGATSGEVSSFKNNFGRFLSNPEGVLGAVNNALLYPTGALQAAGLGSGQISSDAVETSKNLLMQFKQLADRTPENQLGWTLQNHRFDELGFSAEDAKAARNTSMKEWLDQAAHDRTDSKTGNVSDPTLKAWTDMNSQLERAGANIDALFSNKLSALAPGIEKLSGAFQHTVDTFLNAPKIGEWIAEAGKGMSDFANEVDSPKFQDDVKAFADNIDKLAKTSAIAWLAFNALNSPLTALAANLAGGTLGQLLSRGAPAADAAAVPGLLSNPLGWLTAAILGGGYLAGKAGAPMVDDFGRPIPGANWGGPNALAPGSDEPEKPGWANKAWRALTGARPDLAAYENGFHLPPGLLGAIEKIESGGRDVDGPMTRFGKAKGPFQFLDGTAAELGIDPHDEGQAAWGAAKKFAEMQREFHGDIRKSIAGYNEGPAAVEAQIKQYGADWDRHLPKQTADYLAQADGLMRATRALETIASKPGGAGGAKVSIENKTGNDLVTQAAQLAH